jgi:hypothetical protein
VSDLPGQMQNVWSALASVAGGRGAAVMFIAARSGTGTSLVARGFAELAATRAPRAAWLLDLDLFANGQLKAMGGDQAGWPGPYDMTFGRVPFWRATPRSADGSQGEGAVVAYRAGQSKLFVSAFRREALQHGQTLQVAPATDYWRSVCGAIDVTVVDAPSMERSRAGLALVPDMDGVVLVIDGDAGDPADALELRDEVLGRGGACLGAVVVEGPRRKPRGRLFGLDGGARA